MAYDPTLTEKDKFETASEGSPKVYRASLVQSGTSEPIVTVFRNDFSTLPWNYAGVGDFVTSGYSFTAEKTFCLISYYSDPAATGEAQIGLDGADVKIRSFSSGSLANGVLDFASVEIIEYP